MKRMAWLLIAFMPLAQAQWVPAPPPTDVDLLAAYCLAVFKDRLMFINQQLPTLAPDQRAIYEKGAASMRATHERIRMYMIGRVSAVDPTGMIIALHQGDQDMRTLETYATDGQALSPAWESLLEKVRRCDGPNLLPY